MNKITTLVIQLSNLNCYFELNNSSFKTSKNNSCIKLGDKL